MKTMKALCMGWFPILLGCLLFVTCSDDDVVKKKVEEGLPVSLKFGITVPKLDDVPVTRASDAVETELQQLALFFYKVHDTTKPFFVKVMDNFGYGPLQGDYSTTNYIYEFEISEYEGLESGKYYLYAIGNWANAFCNIDLNECRTLSLEDLKNKIISRSDDNNALDLIGFTPMSGKFSDANGEAQILPLQPGENDLTSNENWIRLRRAVAKVIFNFKTDEGVTFTPESYSIYNFSLSSTLIDRDGWNDTTQPGDLQYKGNDGFRNFEDLKFSDDTPNGFTFYMLENVQHAKKTDGLTQNLREKREFNDNDNTRGNFMYASDKATYVVVKGYYEGPGEDKGSGENNSKATGDVTYTILLGDFNDNNVSNFTTRRNVRYTYTVTVKGVNNIITEAKAEDSSENQPGAEGNIIAASENAISIPLDAHYEKVLLRIPVDLIKNPMFYVSTPFSRTIKGISANDDQITDDSKDYQWIHFAKPDEKDGTITFGKFNNGVDLVNVHELLKEMGNTPTKDGDHYIVRDGHVYTTAYVDEYFYTENPNGGTLNLSDFINKPDRVMNICTTKHISKDGNSSYVAETIITFRQNAIYTMYPLTGISIPFGIEKKNEWGNMTRGTTNVDGSLTINHGWENTQKLINTVESHYMQDVGYRFDDLNSQTPTFSQGTVTDPRPYIAAMSRNRDVNDNGTIDEDEMKWYIPARNQCLALWMGNNDLGEYRPYNAEGLAGKKKDEVEGPDGLLHTSSGGNALIWWAIEGAAFGKNYNVSNNYDMRCIRNLSENSYKAEPTKFSDYNNNIITVNGLSNNSLRTSIMTGEYTAGHTERMTDNNLPRAFEVAKADLVITTGDTYVPQVEITDQSYITENRTYQIHTVTLSIKREDGHKYYVGTSSDFNKATEITTDSYEGTVQGHSSNWGYVIDSYLYIFSENGNYVEIYPERTGSRNNYSYAANKKEVIIEANKISTKETFTPNEIRTLVNLAAANYSQEYDGSDKGQWRVPNQRELGLMMVYNKDLNLSEVQYACSTFFTAGNSCGKTYPFQLNNADTDNPFITLATNETDAFYIRPVRDTNAPASSTKSYDSSFSNNGTGFGIR